MTALASNYGPLVCQFCRTTHPNRLEAAVCATTHPRDMPTAKFAACDGCSERVFVGATCAECGTVREARS